MLEFLDALPLWALGALTVGACVSFGLGASALTHRAGWTLHVDDIDSGTVLHALVGLIYAVVLGLIVVNVQSDHDAVRQSTIAEAGALSDIHDALGGLDPDARDRLRAHLRRYVEVVVTDEWPELRQGRTSPAAERELRALSAGILTLRTQAAGAPALHRTLLEELDAASDARRHRVFVGSRGINRATWLVVILGAMISVGFAALFPVRGRGRAIMVTLAASILGLMLFLVVATSRPLRGQLGVGPDAFVELAATLGPRPDAP